MISLGFLARTRLAMGAGMLDVTTRLARWNRRRRWLNLVSGSVAISVGVILATGYAATQIYICPPPEPDVDEMAQDEPNVDEMVDAWEEALRRAAEEHHAVGADLCDNVREALLIQWRHGPLRHQRWFDPWGSMWQFQCDAGSIVTLRSKGPDSLPDTEDDIVRTVDVSR